MIPEKKLWNEYIKHRAYLLAKEIDTELLESLNKK